MCQLLGMSFNLPVNPRISFRGFRYRGESNPHGWGIAFYPDKSVQVIKEPVEANESPLAEFLQNYQEIKSNVFVAHVRYSSGTSKSHRNTHPFCRELNGREYVFAHNGTLKDYEMLRLGRFKPVGETDSEYAFCYLLGCIEEKSIEKWEEKDFKWLAEILVEINSYGRFNCIFSDGEYLFCYHDKGCYNGLCFVRRQPPYGETRLFDDDWEVNLAQEKDPNQSGYIIATESLTTEHWEDFEPGELIIFKRGEIIYRES